MTYNRICRILDDVKRLKREETVLDDAILFYAKEEFVTFYEEIQLLEYVKKCLEGE